MKCCKIKLRHTLIIYPPLAWIATIFYPKLSSNYYFVTPIIFLWSYLIFYNFPFLVKILHTRPTYFEDLHDNTLAEERRKLRYQNIFIKTLQFGAAISIAVLVDYWMYQVKPNTSWSEAFGITGGILGTFGTALVLYGNFILTVLKMKKDKVETERIERTKRNYFRRQRYLNGVEMVTINPISKRSISAQNIAALDNEYSVHQCGCADEHI